MHIPANDFRWYAAFHDEGEHPHVHMMAWSVKPGQAYLSKDGITKIKSMLTNDIFKHEMFHTYEQKSAARDELVRRARDEMKALGQEMRQCIGDHPEVESLMMTLVTQLETVKGKKKYGYLPKDAKNTVDAGVTRTFAPHTGELEAACGSYAKAFKFLCSAADIPCITISTTNHTWNLVYVDNQWLHVDVAYNDHNNTDSMLMAESYPNHPDQAPEATEFLKELLVSGSTK